jgi:hypothetical protein
MFLIVIFGFLTFILKYVFITLWAGIAQSVQRLATGWKVRGLNPGGDEVFHAHPDGPWGPLSLLYSEYRVSLE